MSTYMCQNDSQFFIAARDVSNEILEAMENGVFEPDFDDEGNIVAVLFEGEVYQSYHPEMLGCIAPVVKHGSFIEMWTDGGPFRWYFARGECKEIFPDIKWPDMSPFYKLWQLRMVAKKLKFRIKVRICGPILSLFMKIGGENGKTD